MKIETIKKIVRIILIGSALYFLNSRESIAPEGKDRLKDPRKVVVLDPGHGMSNKEIGEMDWGDATYKDYREADLVLKQAKKIKEMLDPRYYNVILTRETNEESTPVSYRPEFANKVDADFFISLHINDYHKRSDIRGFEIYYTEDKSKDFAELAAKNLEEMTSIPKRKVKQESYLMLKEGPSPAILVESGYLRNRKDRGCVLDTNSNIEKAIVKSIEEYLK